LLFFLGFLLFLPAFASRFLFAPSFFLNTIVLTLDDKCDCKGSVS
jgi:hypothetical protein